MAAKKAVKKKAKKKAPAKKAVKKKSPAKKTAQKAVKKKAAVKKTAKKSAPKKKAVKKKAVKKKTAASKTARKSPVKSKAAPKTAAGKPAPKKLTASQKKYRLIREKLVQQRNDLLTEAESAMNALPEQTVFPDLGDQASAETDRNFMLRLRGREQKLLNKIEETIERIDNDEFGICDACGEEISTERLMARPVASLCIECKLEQEEEEKLKGK